MSKQKRYAIVDLETTGGMAQRDKIIEIGIVIFDGNEIVQTFESLINPERTVPPFITSITGIDTEMIADAPKFYEVAKQVVEMTESCIFVAHNVHFDYGFLREEFSRLGFTYTRRKMCTVRLCRQCFPGLRSYSLGNLIRHFGISNNARHRALGDAMATTELLKNILRRNEANVLVDHLINMGIKQSKLPPSISMDVVHALPETCGVYYMHNSFGKVVYVGKSINIQKRIAQHFSETTKKAENLRKAVHDISYEETGSELVSMILESFEIKKLQPEINKAQRAQEYPYLVYEDMNTRGYKIFRIARNSKKAQQNFQIIHAFSKVNIARSAIKNTILEFELCTVINELEESVHSCFNYKIEKCLGACIEQEDKESYNARFEEAKWRITKQLTGNYLLIEAGRTKGEHAVIQIQGGEFIGYGYIESEWRDLDLSAIMECIKPMTGNQEITQIILRYCASNPGMESISYTNEDINV